MKDCATLSISIGEKAPLHSLTRQGSQFYFLGSNPRPTRNTWPSGCRRCISRTFHGISAGGYVDSRPPAAPCFGLCASTALPTPLHPAVSPALTSALLPGGVVAAAPPVT